MIIHLYPTEGKEFLVGVWNMETEALISVATFADILTARQFAKSTYMDSIKMDGPQIAIRIYNIWGQEDNGLGRL